MNFLLYKNHFTCKNPPSLQARLTAYFLQGVTMSKMPCCPLIITALMNFWTFVFCEFVL